MDRLASARTGAELWYSLVELAGLEPETSYDRDICDQVGRTLRVGWGSDLGEEIERAGSDPTDVLIAVLGALQPWAEMMRDLVELMNRCGANRTRTQLRAEVDVGRAAHELDLDLSNFTEAITEYEEVAATAAGPAWTIEALEELSEVVPSAFRNEGEHLRDEVRRWLEEYAPDSQDRPNRPDAPWPTALPPPPTSGDREFDRTLRVAWSACEALMRMIAEVSTSRLDLREKGERAREGEGDPSRRGKPTLAWLAMVESDFLAGFLVTGLEDIARRVREGDESKWGWAGKEHSPSDLHDLIDRLPVTDGRTELLKRVRELLSLPVWKHRYDLYSNWVFTVIVAGLEEIAGVAVEHNRGLIEFGFKATKMATVEDLELDIYCELRSPLVGESDKRKKGVQPDYSILRGDAADPAKSSLVEIECKQYKSAGKQNFAAALQDYARSRSEASVLLVNYGPIGQRARNGILQAVDPMVRTRCQVIGDLRPPSPRDGDPVGARAEFVDAIHSGIGIESAGLLLPSGAPIRIDLFWESSPTADLDLHLALDGPGAGGERIYYSRLTAGDPVHARLIEDVREGPGPETLVIERRLDATYRLWVHRYDGGGELKECRPRVEVSSAGLKRSLPCPDGSGAWWCVLEVDGASGRLMPAGRRDETSGGA